MNNEISFILEEISIYKKHITQVNKILNKIGKLNSSKEDNIIELEKCINKLDNIIQNYEKDTHVKLLISDWLTRYRKNLIEIKDSIEKTFGIELESKLRELNIPLSGQYPELNAGLYSLVLNFGKQEVYVWYGPKQERLGICPLSATKITKYINDTTNNIGSKINGEEFLKILHRAYGIIAGKQHEEKVPIMQLLPLVSLYLQGDRFHKDPKKENYRGYSRADFSYDIYRIRQNKILTHSDKQLHIIVATRAYTKKRQDFIWIPENLSGKGSTYSHIEFRG